MSPPYPWPHGSKACITITMDNMGEAADIHRGIWPSSSPIGSFAPTTTTSLPSMLEIFAAKDIPVTYFVEAWNCDVYPHIIKNVRARGHEVGFHALQHEVWHTLDAETEARNLKISVQKARDMGGGRSDGEDLVFKGFRPPGGLVTPRTLSLMKEYGMRYLSPAARRPAVVDGVAMLPFQWRDIDAYFYMSSTGSLRLAKGEEEGDAVLSPQVLKQRLMKRVEEVVETGGYLSLLFHPFLQVNEERLEVMREVVAFVAEKRDREGVWVARCEDVADWVLEKGVEVFGDDPGWDKVEWKKK